MRTKRERTATPVTTRAQEEAAQALADSFHSLPSPDLAQRLAIEPHYPEVRDEIIQPDRVTLQSWYFWQKWVPRLGPVPTALFIRLRMHCYYNRHTGERRDFCFPSQTKLAQEIGLKDRKVIMRALRVLEEHGLVKRESQYRYDPVTRKKTRTSDLYRVSMTDPLAPEDLGEAALLTAQRIVDAAQHIAHEETEHGEVQSVGPKSQKGTYICCPKKGQEEVLLRSTSNNVNVNAQKLDREQTQNQETDLETHALRESLAQRIAEELEDHTSLGFYRLVAEKCPEEMIWRALSETKDAYLTGRIKKSRGACFTDLIKREARERAIILSITGEEP